MLYVIYFLFCWSQMSCYHFKITLLPCDFYSRDKEYCQLLKIFHAIKEYLKLLRFMKSVNWPKPGYASITCSTISNNPYNLIFTTKFNDSSILIIRNIWNCWTGYTCITWFGPVYAFHKPLRGLSSVNRPKPGYIV